jgi:hypothetical protein
MEGDFESIGFVKTDASYLRDVYDAITKLQLWDEVKSAPPSRDFCHSFFGKIQPEMKYADEHSGESFFWTIKRIILLAKIGWENFVNEVQKK